MCRYSFKNYKAHYACFECRKAFKQPFKVQKSPEMTPRGTVFFQSIIIRHIGAEKCPECKKPMQHMGHDFKTPKRSNLKQWKKVERLFFAGFRYFSCGCDGPGERPRHLHEVPEFLHQNRSLSEGQRLLELFSRR